MAWIDPSWRDVWRVHRWVFVVWLASSTAIVAMLVVALAQGFSPAFHLLLAIGLVLQLIHTSVVKRLARRPGHRRPLL